MRRGEGPCADAAEGRGEGGRVGGRCLSPSPAAAEAPAEQPAAADSPRWLAAALGCRGSL